MPERLRLLTAFACALLLPGPVVAAQAIDSAPEYSIKAAYLYNFASYVDWPPGGLGGAGASFVIGVLGDERIAEYLVPMTEGREIHGRPVEIRQVADDDPVDSLHMLFIAEDSAGELPRLQEAAREHALLIVTDWKGALESGSVINFRLIDERVRFEVSLKAARDCGLSISSRMLAVAQRVVSEDRQ